MKSRNSHSISLKIKKKVRKTITMMKIIPLIALKIFSLPCFSLYWHIIYHAIPLSFVICRWQRTRFSYITMMEHVRIIATLWLSLLTYLFIIACNLFNSLWYHSLTLFIFFSSYYSSLFREMLVLFWEKTRCDEKNEVREVNGTFLMDAWVL